MKGFDAIALLQCVAEDHTKASQNTEGDVVAKMVQWYVRTLFTN